MPRALGIAAGIAALTVCACYQPHFDNLTLACSSDAECPPGMSCTSFGRCCAGCSTIQGEYRLRFAKDTAGCVPTTVEHDFGSGELHIDATLDDGKVVPVTYDPSGTFTFTVERTGQRYRLRFTTGLGVREVQLAGGSPNLTELRAGRVDATALPASPPNPLTVIDGQYSYIGAPASEPPVTVLASTGLWTMGLLKATTNPFDFAWNATTPIGSPTLGLLDGNQQDCLFALAGGQHQDAANGGTYSRFDAYGVAPSTFVLTGGGATSASFMMSQPPPDRCAYLADGIGTDFARVASATGATYASPAGDWQVYAAPAPDQILHVGALPVAAESIVPPADTASKAMFADPFPGTALLASAGFSAPHELALPSTSVPVADTYREYNALPADCSTPLALHGTVGIPGTPSVNGTPLDANGKTIVLPRNKPVQIAWSIAGGGPVDVHEIALYDLSGATQGLPPQILWDALSDAPQVWLDPQDFADGHTYAFDVGADLGYPGFAQGDYTNFQLPYEAVQVWSRPFLVSIAP